MRFDDDGPVDPLKPLLNEPPQHLRVAGAVTDDLVQRLLRTAEDLGDGPVLLLQQQRLGLQTGRALRADAARPPRRRPQPPRGPPTRCGPPPSPCPARPARAQTPRPEPASPRPVPGHPPAQRALLPPPARLRRSPPPPAARPPPH